MSSSCLYSLVTPLHATKLNSFKNLAFLSSSSIARPKGFPFVKKSLRTQIIVCSSADDVPKSMPSGENIPSNFCIIEGPETVEDFVQMQLQEIQDNIGSRRNKIFLLMEEVRRLRIQQHIKSKTVSDEMGQQENEMPDIPSSIPFLSHVTPKTLKQLYLTSFSFISGIIVFGGLLAPILELKLGLGGTSYEDFIHSLHLPMQLRYILQLKFYVRNRVSWELALEWGIDPSIFAKL